jgi:hypothetical protein
MPELSLANIDQISKDVRNEEISFSHLLDNLIDHVCCDVEDEMMSGLDFQEAYNRVRKKMGSDRRLREIQAETLYAVDSKYRKMKNTMKISGITGTIIFGVAVLFKIQHWPGAGAMLTIGAMILALIFLPSSLIVLWKETHNMKRLILFVSGFISCFTFITGTLFKVQHWPLAGMFLLVSAGCAIILLIPSLLSTRLGNPEATHKKLVYYTGAAGVALYSAGLIFKIQHWPASSILLILGLITLTIIALPWYTYLTWKDETSIKAKFIFILITAMLIILPGTLINLNLQNRYESSYFTHLDKQKALYMAVKEENMSFLESHKDSVDYAILQSVHNKTAEITGTILSMEAKMINESEGNPGKPANTSAAVERSGDATEISYDLLKRPFDPNIAASYLAKGSSSREQLEIALDKYAESFTSLVSPEELLNLKMLSDPDLILPELVPDNGPVSLLSVLHSTAVLKNNLAIIESRVLHSAANKTL